MGPHEDKKSLYSVIVMLVALLVIISVNSVASAETAPRYDAIRINSAITPATAQYIKKSMDEVKSSGADGIIILLDTPGGLDLAMRDIVKELLNSSFPVIVYVYPSGARAASAGVMITMSAHVAAMAKGTNIGAAHPVAIGVGGKMDETMARKVENDAVAYAKGIARKRKRNEEWVEKAVIKSESITAEEALTLKVIDVIADDLDELMRKIHGFKILLPDGEKTLETKDAVIIERHMGFRERVLSALSNPNIAYLLLMIGLAGLYFEFSNPGAILPGVVGGISIILAFFALQTLPVNFAGILLIMFAAVLFIAEIKIVSHGMLTVAGIISLVLGSVFMFESPIPALRVSIGIMIPTIVIVSLFFIGVITLAIKAQMRKPSTGIEGMIGEEGSAITSLDPEGKVLVKGEYWNAFSSEPIEKGEKIRVEAVSGLKLEVIKNHE